MIYKIQPGKTGILCALFESFTKKEKPTLVTSGTFQTVIGEQIKVIENDENNAKRVENGLRKIGGNSLVTDIFYALKSGNELKENACFLVAAKCLEKRKNVLGNYADETTLFHYDLCRQIAYETHRMTGFLRFTECSGGFYAAVFSPDNDIIDGVAWHFCERFKGYPFLIADEKRKKILFYDGTRTTIKEITQPVSFFATENDEKFVALFKKYFSSVSIAERKNERLQDGWLPRRYRKHMPEFSAPKNFN